MPLAKRSIVLVHGAWHSPKGWDQIRSSLESDGYEVSTPELISTGLRNSPVASHREDTAIIQQHLQELVSADKDIIIVMHSYGGLAGGDAVEGFVKGKDNDKGGVVAAVYLAGFMLGKGKNVLSAFEEPPSYLIPNSMNEAYLDPVDPHSIWYNDVPREISEPWANMLRPQSAATFASPAQFQPWEDVPCTYVMTELDKGIYPSIQQKLIEEAMLSARFPLKVEN